MNEIVVAAIVLGGLGLIFGIGLTIVNKVFHVPVDKRLVELKEAMPGANCGGCGYPGCDACAEAIHEGLAPVNACPVGGAALVEKVSKIMGVEAKHDDVKLTARVRCQGSCDKCGNKFDYIDIEDCRAAQFVSGGHKKCEYGCLGLGSCVKACQFDAIHINSDTRLPEVDEEKCTACGQCVLACPKKLIQLQPINLPVRVLCMNLNKGKLVRSICSIGCIGCGACFRACKFGSIKMVNDLPIIDNDICVGCMECARVCPTKSIHPNFEFANSEYYKAPQQPEIN